ncbi:bifunctional Nucleotide-binding alpha-beta plait domain superfamily/RNA recognition motif domain/RNA-binding domain superfamily [Babesia duncani]|uniref:Bifunctional Nucleotide-binding alpha-beta plait domain superfamily/RNA recognition motif domain/RNA-binding domain superfamily n=1 Tax=Babesia duncani TaxID=323732 RepID=A0AAD9UN16_9APIC|nr:bifunctional Nucleotide-binding alpha-beta plait domain superfamily/RNA recognition motif domain/RNA-binding domain superfamily [Babesia duncani]
MAKESLSTNSKLNMSLDEIKDATRKPYKKSYKVNKQYRYDKNRKGSHQYHQRNEKPHRVYIVKISNLEHTVTKEQLNEMFSSVGEVVKTWIDYDHIDRSKGTGGCIFRFADDAQKAVLKYNNTKVGDKQLELVASTSLQYKTQRNKHKSMW